MLSFSSHVHDDELGKFRRRSLVQYVDRNIHLKQAAAPIAVLGIQQMQNLLTHMGQGGSLLFQTSAFDAWTSSLSIAKMQNRFFRPNGFALKISVDYHQILTYTHCQKLMNK
jgi:hypothetical protein